MLLNFRADISSPFITAQSIAAARYTWPYRSFPRAPLEGTALCRFESWVGQESKLLAAGYISTKAGGPKDAFFDKEAQDKIGKVQEVQHTCSVMIVIYHALLTLIVLLYAFARPFCTRRYTCSTCWSSDPALLLPCHPASLLCRNV